MARKPLPNLRSSDILLACVAVYAAHVTVSFMKRKWKLLVDLSSDFISAIKIPEADPTAYHALARCLEYRMRQDVNRSVRISPAFLWQMARLLTQAVSSAPVHISKSAAQSCSAQLLSGVMVANRFGFCRFANYPYEVPELHAVTPATVPPNAVRRKALKRELREWQHILSPFHQHTRCTAATVKKVTDAVKRGHPVIACFDYDRLCGRQSKHLSERVLTCIGYGDDCLLLYDHTRAKARKFSTEQVMQGMVCAVAICKVSRGALPPAGALVKPVCQAPFISPRMSLRCHRWALRADLSGLFTECPDQGQFDTCASHALAACLEYRLQVDLGECWNVSSLFLHQVSRAPWHTLLLGIGANKLGPPTSILRAMSVAMQYGFCSEEEYPYSQVREGSRVKMPSRRALRFARQVRLTKCKEIFRYPRGSKELEEGHCTPQCIHDIKASLDAGNPVLVSVNLKGLKGQEAFKKSAHAMVIIGYGDHCMLLHNSHGDGNRKFSITRIMQNLRSADSVIEVSRETAVQKLVPPPHMQDVILFMFYEVSLFWLAHRVGLHKMLVELEERKRARARGVALQTDPSHRKILPG